MDEGENAGRKPALQIDNKKHYQCLFISVVLRNLKFLYRNSGLCKTNSREIWMEGNQTIPISFGKIPRTRLPKRNVIHLVCLSREHA